MDSWDIRSLDVKPHQPVVLHSDGDGRAIAINLPGGEAMQEHQTHESAFLVVADGEVEISQRGGETTTAGAGFVARFDANERREVRGTRDARLLLLLNPWPGEGHSRDRAGGGPPASQRSA